MDSVFRGTNGRAVAMKLPQMLSRLGLCEILCCKFKFKQSLRCIQSHSTYRTPPRILQTRRYTPLRPVDGMPPALKYEPVKCFNQKC